VFDLRLAQRAVQAGAEVHTSAAAVGLLRENGAVTGVQVQNLGHSYEVRARLVVAADGVEAQVARWAGLRTVPPLEDYYVGIQFLLGGIGGQFDPHVCEYHVGRSLAPGGYAWVFPKGDDSANVGLVLSANRAADTSAQAYLERFIQKRFRDSSVLS